MWAPGRSLRLVAACLLVSAAVSTTAAKSAEELSFVCLIPKVIYEGDTNMLILDVNNQQEDGKLTLNVVNHDNNSVVHFTKEYELKKADGNVFHLDISDLKISRDDLRRYVSTYRFLLDAKFGETEIHRNTTVRIPQKDILLLVQTDKKIYKQGQKVFIRVMPLDDNLRPRTGGNVTVQISDPLNNVVASWKDVALVDMVVQFDFQLTKEPPMGDWRITVKYDDKKPSSQTSDNGLESDDVESALKGVTFTVAEYSLPKFEVKVTPPPFMLMDATSAVFKICANYTFGKPVSGTLKVNTTLNRYHWETLTIPSNYHEAKINGCYNLTIDTSTLNLTNPSFEYRQIKVVANVFEDKTNEQRNHTASISRTSLPLKLTFLPDTNEKFFRPFMNTFGQLKVTHPDDTPAVGEPIELCLSAKSEQYKFHHQRTDVRLMCKNYTSDDQGMINFVLPPHKPSVVSFSVEATALNHPTKKYSDNEYNVQIRQPRSFTSYRAFYSPSKRYLQFEPVPDAKLPCNSLVNLSAYYTFEDGEKDLQFRYVVLARSRNILSETITVQNPQRLEAKRNEAEVLIEDHPNIWSDLAKTNDKKVARLDFQVDPGSSQLPTLTILLYYVHNGVEVVADSVKVKREICSANKVELRFSETVIQPGAFVDLLLSATPKSQCGYDIVDRSVKLLSGAETNPFIRYRNDLPDREIGHWEYPQANSYCPSSGGQSDYADVESVMLTPGWNVVEYNLKLKTKPCRSTRDGGPLAAPEQRFRLKASRPTITLESGLVGLSGPFDERLAIVSQTAPSSSRIGNDFGGVAATKSVVDVRDYFPELWLFELDAIDGTGKLTKKLTAPHQVTTWSADAVCIHPTDGLGVSENAEIKTFQSFFTEVNLPTSVKRGEKIPIIISTFNYLPHCMPVSISVEPLPGLQVDETTPLKKEICVCEDSSPVHYEVRVKVTDAAEVGDLNVTVTATNSENLAVCENKEAQSVPSRDKITRPLKIIPEGFMLETSESRLLCSKDGGVSTELKLRVPENAVAGSSRSLVSITGDMMGQAASNFDRLIVLPTGCGEQNMAKLMSNLAVYDYLRASKQLDSKTEARILNNLKEGYQNQLKFRGREGTYSVWGGNWGEISSFLTAMVYDGLRQAKNHIFVDDAGQAKTLEYLLRTQDPMTGCFMRVGTIYNWPLRRSESSDETKGSYTAYILTTLRGAIDDKRRLKKALLCVQAQKNMNAYALALSAYAAALHKEDGLATKYLDELKVFENTKLPNQKFYAKDDSASSDAVITAAYAVLAQLELAREPSEDVIQAVQPIVRWLMKKQNRNGGFSSSQDTVLGLRAISKFATVALADQKGIDIDLNVKGEKFDEAYKITKDNAIIWDTRIVDSIPNDLSVSGTGSGCVVVSSQLRYNLPSIPGEKGFDFNITVTPESTVEHVILDLCISYEGEGGQPSSMAIVELDLLTGYTADKESLTALTRSPRVPLFEIEDNRVVIYFDQFVAIPTCSKVQLNREFEVEDLKPATAKVYDYYDGGKQKSIEYERGDLQSDLDNV